MSTTSIFPSANTWTTPRTDQIKLTTDNCKLFTNSKIDKLEKMLAKFKEEDRQSSGKNYVEVGLSFIYTNAQGKEQLATSNFPLRDIFYDEDCTQSLFDNGLDITKYVVEKSLYSTLPLKPDTGVYPDYFPEVCKNNTFFWTQATSEINIVNEPFTGFLQIFAKYTPQFLLASSIYSLIQNQGVYVKYSVYPDPLKTEVVNADTFRGLSFLSSTNFDLTEVLFRVYYQSLGESVKINTPKTRPTTAQQFTMPFSQQQQIVDSIAQGRNTLATANRTGVRKKEVLRTITDLSQLRKLGAVVYQKDSNGNPTNAYWRLIEIEKTVYPRKMVVKETWAENWSFESEYTAVDRRFRSWNIPSDILQRNCLWEDYCVITDGDNTVTGTGALITTDAQKLVLQTLVADPVSRYSECLNMWLYQRTINTLEMTTYEGVALNCSAFGYGNSLVFAGRTKDNLSAGIQRSADDDTYCRDVYYCNDDGTLQTVWWQIGASMQNDSGNNGESLYPQYKSVEYTSGGTNTYLNAPNSRTGTLLIENALLNLRKAPAEQINPIYQLHILSVADDIIVGTAWASGCPLVKEWKGTTIVRKTWALTRKLPQGTQTMTSRYGQEVTGETLVRINLETKTFGFTTVTTVPNCVGICLTDGDNNIIVAQNVNATKTYQLQFTHDYKQVVAFDKQYNERLAALKQVPTLAQLRAQGEI